MRNGFFFFFQAEDGIRDYKVTGVQTCALPISNLPGIPSGPCSRRRNAHMTGPVAPPRSEERRVGKECRSRWSPYHQKKNKEDASCRNRVMAIRGDIHRGASLYTSQALAQTHRKIFFFFQAEDGIRDYKVTGVQTCALPILAHLRAGQGHQVDPVRLAG